MASSTQIPDGLEPVDVVTDSGVPDGLEPVEVDSIQFPQAHEISFKVGGAQVPNEAMVRLQRDAEDDALASEWLRTASAEAPNRPLDVEVARRARIGLQAAQALAPHLKQAYVQHGLDGAAWRRSNPGLFEAVAKNPDAVPIIRESREVARWIGDVDAFDFAGADTVTEESTRIGVAPSGQTAAQAFAEGAGRAYYGFKRSLDMFRAMAAEAKGDTRAAGMYRRRAQEYVDLAGPPVLYEDGRKGAEFVGSALTSGAMSLPATVGGAGLALAGAPAWVGAAGVAASQWPVVVGSAYADLDDAIDDDGNPIDERTKMGFALLSGTVQSAVESMNVGVGAKALHGAARDLVRKQGVRSIVDGFLAHAAKQGLVEGGVEEPIQAVVDEASRYLARVTSAGKLQTFNLEAAVENVVESAVGGFIGGAAIGGGTFGMAQVFADGMALAEARGNARKIDALVGVAKSQAAREAPRAVLEIVRSHTSRHGAAPKVLAVDPERFTAAATSQGADPTEVATLLMGEGGPARVEAAVAARIDEPGKRATLEIPIGEFIEKWGSSKIVDALRQDLTTGLGEYSAREAAEIEQATGALAEKFAAQLADVESEPSPDDIDARNFEQVDSIVRSLVAAGHTRAQAQKQAALWAAFATTAARRTGQPVGAVWERLRARVSSQVEIDTATPQARVLEEKLEAMGVEGRAELLARDPLTGALSFQGLEMSSAPEGKPALALVSVPGLKWRNSVSHAEGDKWFRLIAAELAGLSPQVSRHGGDFIVAVSDEAEGESVAAELERRMISRLRSENPGSRDDIRSVGVMSRTFARPASDLGSVVSAEAVAFAKAREPLVGKTQPERGARPVGLPDAITVPDSTPIEAAIGPGVLQKARAMRPGDVFGSAFIDPMTGMLRPAAWALLPERKHKAVMDIRLVRQISDTMGRKAGDAVIEAFALAADLAGGSSVDATRGGGDEFWFQADDEASLRFFVDVLLELAQGLAVQLENDPRTPTLNFVWGIGATKEAADDEATRQKSRGDAAYTERALQGVSKEAWRAGGGLAEASRRFAGSVQRSAFPGHVQGLGRSDRGRRRLALGRVRAFRSGIAGLTPSEIADHLRAATGSGAFEWRRMRGATSSAFFRDRAVAEVAARVARPRSARPSFRSTGEAFDDIMHASGYEDSPSHTADAAWRRGEKPDPSPDGMWDPANEYLAGLQRTGKGAARFRKVSGLREAFDRLMRSFPGPLHARAAESIAVLRQVQGLERLRLPDEFIEAALIEREEAEQRAAEDERYSETAREQALEQHDRDWMDRELLDEDAQDPGDVGYFQADPASPAARGWAKSVETAAGKLFRVFLSEHADLSTFAHESAHVFLEVMGELAGMEDSHAAMRGDYAAIRKWLGAKPGESITSAQHEKFARGFEQYLLEGKAPSEGLAGVFAAFALWLKRIYLAARGPGQGIDDVVRGLFDRMLATDAEIARVRSSSESAAPLWRSHEDAGMTPDEWQRYLEARAEITHAASARVRAEIAKAKLREAEVWRGEERVRLTSEAEAEYDDRRDVRTWRYITKGERYDRDGLLSEVGNRVLLDKQRMIEALGAGHPLLKRLGKSVRASGGVHPGEVAELLGYLSPGEMLAELSEMPDRDAWVEARAKEMLHEAHPDIDAVVSDLRGLVEKATHAEMSDKQALEELAALGRMAGQKSQPAGVVRDAYKRAAAQMIGSTSLGALRKGRLDQMAQRASHKAVEHAVRGNHKDAVVEKQRQLMYREMWRLADAALDQREVFVGLASDARKMTTQERLGRAGGPIRDTANAIIAFARGEPMPRDIELDMPALVKMFGDMGFDHSFDEQALARTLERGGGLSTATVAEMGNALAALREVSRLASMYGEVRAAGRLVDREAAVAAVVDEIMHSKLLEADRVLENTEQAKSFADKMEGLFLGYDAFLMRPATVLRSFVGGDKHDSAVNEFILDRLADAAASERGLNDEALLPLLRVFEEIPADLRRKLHEKIDTTKIFRKHTEGLSTPATRFELVMVAVNFGNESNAQRLLDGRGMTDTEVLTALGLLDESELELAQAIIDAAERLWPHTVELEIRERGFAPDKIPARPYTVITQDGAVVTMRGGYFPAVYDKRVSDVGRKQEATTIAALMPGVATRPTTSRSHTKARADRVSQPIALDPANIGRHLFSVTHDIAFRETLRSVGLVLLDKRVEAAMYSRLGEPMTKAVRQWLIDVGRLDVDHGHGGALAQFAWKMRAPIVRTALGWSLRIAIGDLLTPLTGIVSNKALARHLLPAFWNAARADFRMTVRDLSPAAAGRLTGSAQEFGAMMGEAGASLHVGGGKADWIKRNAFLLQEAVDRYITPVIWSAHRAMYEKQGKPPAVAAKLADAAVTDLLPAQHLLWTSALQRDRGALGALLMMQGYLNTIYQQQRRITQPAIAAVRRAKDKRGTTGEASLEVARATAALVVLAFFTQTLGELVMGKGPDPEDESPWLSYLLKTSLLGIFASAPFAEDVAKVVSGQPASLTSRQVPVVGLAVRAASEMSQVGDLWVDGEYDRAWRLANALAPIAGGAVPLQVLRSAEYFYNLANGEAEYTGPLGILGGSIYGESLEHPKLNLFTAIEEGL